MLAPLEKYETEETRKNLWLRTKDGSVDADVWVVGGTGADTEWKGRQKAQLGVKTKDGRVSLRLHSLAPSPSAPRTPISLFMKTKDGSLRLSIPRTFMGPLTITRKDARYRFSPALSAVTTVFSDSRGVTRCFVGNLAHSGWADAPGAWGGDEVDIITHDGRVSVQFDDEVDIITHDGRVWVQFDDEVEEEKAKSPMKEFFGRVFGV
uniref:DUF7330 domain-containing protein n=1 Tax=Mycena chlorophos TaxID=658473 RepID=A0ABQ0LII5_MYCCL|nr:predicted protein [Mycena chlorophos]